MEKKDKSILVYLKDKDHLPRSNNSRSGTIRKKKIEKHVKELHGTVFCPGLNADVAFVNHPSTKEMIHHSSKSKDSTLFALNIEKLLKKAKVVKMVDPKKGDKSQQKFYKMIILEQKVKGHGTAKIVVGKYRRKKLFGTKYCQYCVTRKYISK